MFLKVGKMNWIIGLVMAIVAILGLFFIAGGQFIALDYKDFPRDTLEKLVTSNPLETMTITGSLEVEVDSSMTQWAMMFLPGTFFVDVRINGRKASLSIDTGAAQSFISPHLAAAAQISLTSSRLTVQHGWREIPVYMGYIRDLELGDMKIQNMPAIVGGQQPVVKLLGLPVWNFDGVLGMEPLRRLVLLLDYKRRVVVLRREPFPSQVPSAPLQILTESGLGGLEHPKPIVECFVNNSGPFSCFIDTGTSAPIFVPREIWQTLHVEGQRQARLGVRIGELELKDVPAIKANVKHITIGSNIFQAQGFKRLTLDFLAGKLYAER